MKEILKAEQAIGGDGAKASESIILEGGFLKAKVEVSYPVAQALKPVVAELEVLKGKLKAIVPFDAVTDPLIDAAFKDGEDALVKLLSE